MNLFYRIGPYQIERMLGQGGSGEVYLASREGDFEMKVALKRLKHDLPSANLIDRFEKERQIMANLSHPNIARLLDGGALKNGQPWLVMEYVEGLELLDWCARNNATIRQRLELFLKICDAVSHAHRNLIIHRDLKPSNIVVTMDGNPKLLEFSSRINHYSSTGAAIGLNYLICVD